MQKTTHPQKRICPGMPLDPELDQEQVAESEAGWMYHERVRSYTPFPFSEALKFSHSVAGAYWTDLPVRGASCYFRWCRWEPSGPSFHGVAWRGRQGDDGVDGEKAPAGRPRGEARAVPAEVTSEGNCCSIFLHAQGFVVDSIFAHRRTKWGKFSFLFLHYSGQDVIYHSLVTSSVKFQIKK